MKITIDTGKYSYSVDYSKENKIEGGFVDEYSPTPKEILEDICNLLENLYGREKIDQAVREVADE